MMPLKDLLTCVDPIIWCTSKTALQLVLPRVVYANLLCINGETSTMTGISLLSVVRKRDFLLIMGEFPCRNLPRSSIELG